MGYTHYWTRKDSTLDSKKFEAFVADCKKVCELSEIPLAGWDGKGKPRFGKVCVSLNGRDDHDDSFETFRFNRIETYQCSDGKYFAFCKTGRRRYDTIVTACLIIADHHFGDAITVRTDGDPEDWEDAKKLCQAILGYGEDFHSPSWD